MSITTIFSTNATSVFEATKSTANANVAKKLIAKDMMKYMDLKEKAGDYQAKILSYNILKNSIKFLKDSADKLRGMYSKVMTTESSNNTYVTATANFYAASNNYSIQIKSIAQAQTIYSNVFADKTSAVASGTSPQYLKITSGATSSVVEVITDTQNSGFNNTLEGITSAINSANSAVSASVEDVFNFTSSNNSLKFTVGTDQFIASITTGVYSTNDVATAVQTALNNAYGQGSDKFSVSYDSTNKKFTIQNNTGLSVTFLFDDPLSTASSKLGFSGTAVLNNSESTEGATADLDYRLKLSANSLGEDNRIKIQVNETENNFDPDNGYNESGINTDTTGLSILAFNPTYDSSGNVSGGITNMSQSQSATNAVFKIGGTEYTRNINNISDVVMGVTFNLLKADENYDTDPQTIKVAVTPMMLGPNLYGFVSNINSLNSIIQSQLGTAAKPGTFDNELVINDLQAEMKNIIRMNSTNFATIGISVDTKGKFIFDSVRFKNAVLDDSKEVSRIVMSLALSYSKLADKYETNIVPKKTDELNQEVEKLNKEQDRLYTQIKLKELIANPPPVPAEVLLKTQQVTSPFLDFVKSSGQSILNRKKKSLF